MKCSDVRAAYLAGEPSGSDKAHLESCADCQAEWLALQESNKLLADRSIWEPPPDNLEDRLVAMISGPADVAAIEREAGTWWRYAATGIAAAAIVLLGVWIGVRAPAPDWEVALPGTDEAPLAVGVVSGWNEAGGTRMVLDIQGLPEAPDGFIYEFWLTKGDLHISAGTFRDPRGVELWAGVSRADFPRLWITLEPVDDDERPSGINVMDTA